MGVSWGWVVCLSFLCLFTMAVGMQFSFGALIIPINRDIHASLSVLGWLGGLHIGIPMIGAPIATWIYYKLGAMQTVIVGVLGATVCFALTPLSPNIVVLFIVLGILSSFFVALIINPPFYLLDDYFPYAHPRHVLATSIVLCGFPLATLIFHPLVYVIQEGVGWRHTYSIYAAAMLLIGTALTLTFRLPKYTNQSKETKSASEKHEYEDLALDASIQQRTKLILGVLWFWVSVLKSMGYYTPLMILVSQMSALGIPQGQAASAMSVVGVCELGSRLVMSYLGDCIKGRILHVYVACALLLAVLNLVGALAHTYTALVLYGAALGLLSGPIIAAMYSSCAEVLQGQHVPELFSTFHFGLGIGATLGPPLAGGVFDATDSFQHVYYVNCAIYALCSALCLCIILLNKYRPLRVFPYGMSPTNACRET